MLTALSIRNVVLIDQLDLSFSSGLCVLTGETGAGKSILLDSLGLALGARSDSALVRHGADRAIVTAEFEPVENSLKTVLEEHGLEVSSPLLLRRVLNSDGRSRAFVNDQPASIGLLRRIGDHLVEMQGQFEQHRLSDIATHGDLLDAYGGCGAARNTVAAAFRAWRTATEAVASAAEQAAQAQADQEFLQHAVDELDQLAPQSGEEERLASTRMVLMHAEQLVEAVNGALSVLAGASGAEDSLSAARRLLNRVADKSGGQLVSTIAALDGAIANIEDALRELRAAADTIEHGGSRLDEVEDRLQALRDAARKHNVETEELAALTESLRQRLVLIETQSDRLAQLEEAARSARTDFVDKAATLSKQRGRVAARLEEAVSNEFPALKLEKTRLTVSTNVLEEQRWNDKGVDRVEFLVATNPGAPVGPLSKIASGGELSRLMLALKLTLIKVEQVPTLVFDEVDSAIGGATANAVGERLARLAGRTQVLVVTHSPQVAARGTDHLRVEKTALGDEAITGVDRLGDQGRREEVARMLSGARITSEARAAADRLIVGDGA